MGCARQGPAVLVQGPDRRGNERPARRRKSPYSRKNRGRRAPVRLWRLACVLNRWPVCNEVNGAGGVSGGLLGVCISIEAPGRAAGGTPRRPDPAARLRARTAGRLTSRVVHQALACGQRERRVRRRRAVGVLRARRALRVGPWITLASYPPPYLRLLVIYKMTGLLKSMCLGFEEQRNGNCV